MGGKTMYGPAGALNSGLLCRQVLNKVDLIDADRLGELQQLFESNPAVDTVFATSALRGQGVQEVRQWAASKLPLGPTLYPKVAMQNRCTAMWPVSDRCRLIISHIRAGLTAFMLPTVMSGLCWLCLCH